MFISLAYAVFRATIPMIARKVENKPPLGEDGVETVQIFLVVYAVLNLYIPILLL
jgi:hypothetical protein